jgi:pilus assembly protein CpaB
MNKTQAIFALLASIVSGALAVTYATHTLQASGGLKTVSVVVATASLAPGVRLDSTDLKVVPWPITLPLVGSALEPKALVGRVTAATIQKGEPVLEHRLTENGATPGLSGQISHGKRAFTIKVNEVVGVAGFATPGTYVDVILTVITPRVSSQNFQPKSKIVLERLLVLAAAQEQFASDDRRAKIVGAVTLEVTPQEAEKLEFARSVGVLSLALRNPSDISVTATEGVNIKDVFSRSDDEPLTPAPRRVTPTKKAESRKPEVDPNRSVEVYRGADRDTMSVYE